MTETIAAFMDRRRRETASAGGRAKAAHEAYGKAIRSGQGPKLGGSNTTAAHSPVRTITRVTPAGGPPRPAAPARKVASVGHPGFAESLIPVWGSGREAVADLQEGDNVGAAFNGALAASDLFIAGDIAKAVGRAGRYAIEGAIRLPASRQSWAAARGQMRKFKLLKAGHEGHHWLIPQNGWGKKVPEGIKNHPLNVKGLPKTTHRRVHTRFKGEPRYGLLGQYLHGTPTWWKVATGSAAGHPVAAIEAKSHRR
jgi:hypothetical protein